MASHPYYVYLTYEDSSTGRVGVWGRDMRDAMQKAIAHIPEHKPMTQITVQLRVDVAQTKG